MGKDPYEVLGVSPEATDDEIKNVYRKLSRKYHPDANVGKPDAALAEEKFKDINVAYDEIMDMRSKGANFRSNPYSSGYGGAARTNTGYGQNAYGFNGYEGYSSYQGAKKTQSKSAKSTDWLIIDDLMYEFTPDGEYLRNVVILLNQFKYSDARVALNATKTRSGLYYYLSALTFWKLGETGTAFVQAKMALTMDPQNPDYMNLYVKLQSMNTAYTETSSSYYSVSDKKVACISGGFLVALCGGAAIYFFTHGGGTLCGFCASSSSHTYYYY